MYDIKRAIGSFLRKLQHDFAQSQYFRIHTTERAVIVSARNVLLWDFTK
jgi:hypothetical protein